VLTEGIISKMRVHGIERVRVRIDPSEESVESPEERELFHQIFLARQNLGRALERLSDRSGLSPETLSLLRRQIADFVSRIFEGEVEVLRELQGLGDHDATSLSHSMGVLFFAVLLNRRAEEEGLLRYDWQERVNVGLGSALHDLGKLRIPREILNKPSALSPEEFEVMKTHPALGYEMVREIRSVLPMTRAIVAHHHHRWDGRGYGLPGAPALAGAGIPSQVRLVSVADVYDALIGDRPYRPGMIPARAIRILRQAAGSHLDPRLAPLAERLVVPYPIGSILLFRSGLVGTVVDCGAQGPPYRCYLIASFAESGTRVLGRSVRVFETEEVLLDAEKGVEGLWARFRSRLEGGTLFVLDAWARVFSAAIERQSSGRIPVSIRPVPPVTGAGDPEGASDPDFLR